MNSKDPELHTFKNNHNVIIKTFSYSFDGKDELNFHLNKFYANNTQSEEKF